jgi:hypothetical protein
MASTTTYIAINGDGNIRTHKKMMGIPPRSRAKKDGTIIYCPYCNRDGIYEGADGPSSECVLNFGWAWYQCGNCKHSIPKERWLRRTEFYNAKGVAIGNLIILEFLDSLGAASSAADRLLLTVQFLEKYPQAHIDD